MTDDTSRFAILLEAAEYEPLARIEMDMSKLTYEATQKNGPLVLKLMRSLISRRAIPEIRARYWLDPDYQNGRLKSSHRGLFERNGNTDDETYQHPHFLSYLHYFLYGADLPSAVVASFVTRVGNPDWLTSSDIVPLAKFSRSLARQNGLGSSEAEEFFKLALDVGLPLYTAGAVRRAIAQVR